MSEKTLLEKAMEIREEFASNYMSTPLISLGYRDKQIHLTKSGFFNIFTAEEIIVRERDCTLYRHKVSAIFEGYEMFCLTDMYEDEIYEEIQEIPKEDYYELLKSFVELKEKFESVVRSSLFGHIDNDGINIRKPFFDEFDIFDEWSFKKKSEYKDGSSWYQAKYKGFYFNYVVNIDKEPWFKKYIFELSA